MTSYTIKARLTMLCPIVVQGDTLIEAQDNFEKGEWELYMDPEAIIEDYQMLRIGLDTSVMSEAPLAAPVLSMPAEVQQAKEFI